MPFSATLVTREKRAVTWRVIGSKYFGLGLRDQWFQRLAALAGNLYGVNTADGAFGFCLGSASGGLLSWRQTANAGKCQIIVK